MFCPRFVVGRDSVDVLVNNPFQRPAGDEAQEAPRCESPDLRLPLSKWFTIPLGAIAGGLLAGVVAGALAMIVLIPPWRGLFGFSEFDVLLVFGLPVLAIPGGVLGGLVFGCLWKRQHSWLLATACASLPAVAYFLMTAWKNEMSKGASDQLVSTAVSAVCLVLAASISLKLLARTFASMEQGSKGGIE